jgi:hypothetical protein
MRRLTHRALIALHLSHTNVPGIVAFTRGVGKGLTNNSNLTAADLAKAPITVADLLAAATTLESTHTARRTIPSKANTTLELDQATDLLDHLKNLGGFIEGLANTKAAGDVAVAQSIIQSTGFPLRKSGAKPAKGPSAKSPSKGVLDVFVPADDKRGVRLAQYSIDGGKSWSLPLVVHGAGVEISGLKSGIEAMVRLAVNRPPAKRARTRISAGMEDQVWGDFLTCTIQ